VLERGARIGRYSVIGRHCHIGRNAVIEGAILWPHTRVDADARLGQVTAGQHCVFGPSVQIGDGATFGDKSIVTDYSKV
jgi:NDP-sugar pyrophosphorylase family protein